MNTFAIVTEMSQERGLDRWEVCGPRKFTELVRARKEIAVRLRSEGCTVHEIGRALGYADHTGVLFLLETLGRQRKRPLAASVATRRTGMAPKP